MSDGNDDDPGTDAEEAGVGLGPDARDLEAELAERRRDRFGATAADVEEPGSAADGDEDDELLEPSESEAVDVDSETLRAFWAAVVYVNVGVFAIVLGLLLAGFRGRNLVGAALVGVGAIALYRAWAVYRAFKASDDGDEDERGYASDDHE